jgi:hypothetical protein
LRKNTPISTKVAIRLPKHLPAVSEYVFVFKIAPSVV